MKNLHKKTQLLIGLVILLCIGCGVTFALLSQKSETALNNFKGGTATEQKVNIAIIENDNETLYEDAQQNTLKKNENGSYAKSVKIKNVNTTEYPTKPVYVRVRFVTALKKKDGNSYSYTDKLKVTGTFSTSTKWKYDEINKTFYYTEAIAPDAVTEELLQSVQIEGVPDGYQVEIKVLADAIEANAEVMQKTWKISGFTSYASVANTYDLVKMK